MGDYNVKVTVRNARLLNAIRNAGFETQADYARHLKVNPSLVNEFIAMRKSPIGEDGRLRHIPQMICDDLCALPEDLWTETQLFEKLPRNSVEFEVLESDVAELCSNKDLAQKALERLQPRQRKVLWMRVINEKTLAECADELGVGRERVRQIEAKALRKLRNIPALREGAEEQK